MSSMYNKVVIYGATCGMGTIGKMYDADAGSRCSQRPFRTLVTALTALKVHEHFFGAIRIVLLLYLESKLLASLYTM